MTLLFNDAERMFTQGFDALRENIAMSTGRSLYGVNLDIRESGCRIILKAFTNGRPEIAFVNASSLERCFEVLDSFLHTSSNTGVAWRPDQYYKA